MYLTADSGTELPVENMGPGTVLNAHKFLVQRKHAINVRFTSNTTFYYLKYSKLVEIAKSYPFFAKELLKEKGKAEANKSRDQNPLDYITGSDIYYDPKSKLLEPELAARMKVNLNSLKNATVYLLLKFRKDRKVKNLKKILEEFIHKKNKEKEMLRVKKRELDLLPLAEKIERMIGDDKILTEIQFENV